MISLNVQMYNHEDYAWKLNSNFILENWNKMSFHLFPTFKSSPNKNQSH